MLTNPPFTVTVDEARIHVSMDRTQVEIDELLRFLDYLRIQTFLQRNTLSDEEINKLAVEIKHKTWQRIKRQLLAENKADFLPPEELADLGIPVQSLA
jgi:23S rRNA maturation-related 3'-5' exoribonuclease YhaM